MQVSLQDQLRPLLDAQLRIEKKQKRLLLLSLCTLVVLALIGGGVWLLLRQQGETDARVISTHQEIDELGKKVEARFTKERGYMALILARSNERLKDWENMPPAMQFDLALDEIAAEQKIPANELRALLDLYVSLVEAEQNPDAEDRYYVQMRQQAFVKEALLTINCHPVEQTNFEPDARTVENMLRGKIGDCQALIHICGMRYGAEPDVATLPPGTPRRSYTQMEYHIGRQLQEERGDDHFRVYTFICPEDFPYDQEPDTEAKEKRDLQLAHRSRLFDDPHLRERLKTPDDLKLRILSFRMQRSLHRQGGQLIIASISLISRTISEDRCSYPVSVIATLSSMRKPMFLASM